MKSPFADCEALLVTEPAKAVFRGEEYDYIYRAYECEKTGERFTTTELDEVNTRQVYNQYRERYGIPFEDEIAQLRETYGISAANLSAVLGFGENQVRHYIEGEIPSKTNGRVLGMIRNVDVFERYLESARHLLSDAAYRKARQRTDALKEKKAEPAFEMIYRRGERSIFNGFAAQSVVKLRDVVLLALSLMGDTYTTKMNKVLFYIDMLSYRERGEAITGLAYSAQPYGTIPYRYNLIYPVLDIPQAVFYEGGREYSPLKPSDVVAAATLNESERAVIEEVCRKFRRFTSKDISTANHEEQAWEKYRETGKPIPFSEAFFLKHI